MKIGDVVEFADKDNEFKIGVVDKLHNGKVHILIEPYYRVSIDKKRVKLLPRFPNGFDSWLETHYEIVASITINLEDYKCTPYILQETYDTLGTGGMYELAEKWTNEFEEIHATAEWDGEYREKLDEFLTVKYNEQPNQKAES